MVDLYKSPYANDDGRGPTDLFGNSRTTAYGFPNYKYSGPQEKQPVYAGGGGYRGGGLLRGVFKLAFVVALGAFVIAVISGNHGHQSRPVAGGEIAAPSAAKHARHTHLDVPRAIAASQSEVDPSRLSLSHNPRQWVYTTAPVSVYVHGLEGAVMCTLPPGSMVKARVYSHPAQFNGDVGVLGYRGELCPYYLPSPQRDMYHEIFLRARLASAQP